MTDAGTDAVRIGPLRIERMSGTDAIAIVQDAVAGRRDPVRLAFCNAHTMLLALDRPDYAAVLGRHTLLNDGIGSTVAARWLAGRGFIENLNGTDFVPRLLGARGPRLRIYLLGAKPDVVARAARAVAGEYPDHDVVGWRDGYFTTADEPAILREIARARPDLLLIGMGNPLQEEFAVRQDLGVPVAIGVGALFDFLSGTVPRAPILVRRLRLEWLFRLLVEPRRLGRRYTVGIVRLLWALGRLRRAQGVTPRGATRERVAGRPRPGSPSR